MSEALFLVGSLSSSAAPLPLDPEGSEVRFDQLETMAIALAELIKRVAELEKEPIDHSEDWRNGVVEEGEDDG